MVRVEAKDKPECPELSFVLLLIHTVMHFALEVTEGKKAHPFHICCVSHLFQQRGGKYGVDFFLQPLLQRSARHAVFELARHLCLSY